MRRPTGWLGSFAVAESGAPRLAGALVCRSSTRRGQRDRRVRRGSKLEELIGRSGNRDPQCRRAGQASTACLGGRAHALQPPLLDAPSTGRSSTKLWSRAMPQIAARQPLVNRHAVLAAMVRVGGSPRQQPDSHGLSSGRSSAIETTVRDLVDLSLARSLCHFTTSTLPKRDHQSVKISGKD
jgi:hypothetical protein